MKNLVFCLFAFVLLIFACQSGAEGTETEAEAARKRHATTGTTAPDGMAVFRQNCVTCHGSDGKLGMSGAKDLSASTLAVDSRIQIITNGKNLMTPFKALLSEAEIKAVAEYTMTFK